MGFQDPRKLLQAQGNQACMWWELWGLIAGLGFQEHSKVVLLPV
jgi:hypothetical protein